MDSSSDSSWSSANKRGKKCSYCKKQGHFWKECRKKKFDEQKTWHYLRKVRRTCDRIPDFYIVALCSCAGSLTAHNGFLTQERQTIFVLTAQCLLASKWWIHLGSRVSLGDDSLCPIIGRDIVPPQLESGGTFDLLDVFLVPALNRNLMSTLALVNWRNIEL